MEYLNMSERANRHLKAEAVRITDMSRGETLEILYPDEAVAARKRISLEAKMKGRGMELVFKTAGASVLVEKR